MRRKTQDALTTQKPRRTFQAARTAANSGCPTGSALLAVNMESQLASQPFKIGVDIMGSDNAPLALVDALKELHLPSGVELILICTPKFQKEAYPFQVVPSSEVIEMDEDPLAALRKKKNASVYVGMRLLKEKKIDAFVSAGNTGALVSCAKMILSTLPGISRPCLLALMPTKKNPVAVLDVGANIEVKAAQLVQFAQIGSVYQQARGIRNPSIGILNIGSEALKGTQERREAYSILKKNKSLLFAGNIEGKSAFDGEVDVLVTDGFTGNIFLKTAEGIASLILDRLHAHIPTTEIRKLAPILDDLQKHLYYAEYRGALLAGVRGIVIKCHGYSTPRAFATGVLGALDPVAKNFLESFKNNLL
jgi:phosphate acyltransferase